MEKSGKETVVLYAGLGMGHLTPMTELAKLLNKHRYHVVIVVIDQTITGMLSGICADTSSSSSSISLHVLPRVSVPAAGGSIQTDDITAVFDTIRSHNTHLGAFLRDQPGVRAVVVDFLCSDALSVARELDIPAYMFFPPGAVALALFLYLVVLDETTEINYKDMGELPISCPGVPPIPANHLPSGLLDRDSKHYESSIYHLALIAEADGILVNTFEMLDQRALRALKDGDCLPGREMPPVYAIGPLVSEGNGDRRHECLEWLDSQPEKSVVFLCFGSWDWFSPKQIGEIAAGLENSGQRFLWVVRIQESKMEAVLPVGFVERTAARGMVVRTWAPQVEVLNHAAVGAFVTHCGWNSVLEAVKAGVPVICWPLYAEQRLNKVVLVEEMRIGVEMDGYTGEIVAAAQVEKVVRSAMDPKNGANEAMRERVSAVKKMAVEATAAGGSSAAALSEFVSHLRKRSS